MSNPAQTLSVPVVCDNLRESASKLPDTYILICPYNIALALAYVMYKCTGYEVGLKKELYVGVKSNILCDYAGSSRESFDYLFDIGSNMLKEYKYRFGCEHLLINIYDDIEWNTPELKYADVKPIPLMCKKTPREYIVDYSADKTVSVTSWIVWLRDSQQHQMFYSNREKPFLFKNIKTTQDNKDQYKGIIQYWERFIALQLTK